MIHSLAKATQDERAQGVESLRSPLGCSPDEHCGGDTAFGPYSQPKRTRSCAVLPRARLFLQFAG